MIIFIIIRVKSCVFLCQINYVFKKKIKPRSKVFFNRDLKFNNCFSFVLRKYIYRDAIECCNSFEMIDTE